MKFCFVFCIVIDSLCKNLLLSTRTSNIILQKKKQLRFLLKGKSITIFPFHDDGHSNCYSKSRSVLTTALLHLIWNYTALSKQNV